MHCPLEFVPSIFFIISKQLLFQQRFLQAIICRKAKIYKLQNLNSNWKQKRPNIKSCFRS